MLLDELLQLLVVAQDFNEFVVDKLWIRIQVLMSWQELVLGLIKIEVLQVGDVDNKLEQIVVELIRLVETLL